MPQYTYTPATAAGNTKKAEGEEFVKPEEEGQTDRALSNNIAHEVSFYQPTCPICLDDFVPAETIVRELPCKHIFHPECIDPFLRANSSLCPMCKKSTLPAGYCPVQVTNIMVRRERLIRRMRQRNGREGAPGSTRNRVPSTIAAFDRRVRRLSVAMHPALQHQYGSAGGQHGVWSEMQSTAVRRGFQTDEEIPARVRAQGVSAVRAWRLEQVARQQATAYDQQANETRAADVSRPFCECSSLDKVPDIC
jgi:hypothetical protein